MYGAQSAVLVSIRISMARPFANNVQRENTETPTNITIGARHADQGIFLQKGPPPAVHANQEQHHQFGVMANVPHVHKGDTRSLKLAHIATLPCATKGRICPTMHQKLDCSATNVRMENTSPTIKQQTIANCAPPTNSL